MAILALLFLNAMCFEAFDDAARSRGACDGALMPLCYHASMPAEVKTIGASGQISLGKENAGRMVTVEKVEEGVWIIKAGQFIPDNERWLHTPEMREKLDRAIAWAEKTPPKASNLDELEKRIQRRR